MSAARGYHYDVISFKIQSNIYKMVMEPKDRSSVFFPLMNRLEIGLIKQNFLI